MSKRIMIMAGGTGGHVFPALAVAQYLKEQGWQVSWLGTTQGLENRVIPAQGIEIDWLSVAGVRGKGLFAKVIAVLKLSKACVQALKILRQRQPDVVLGMGGFVAAPGGLMSKLLGIPLVIHEQNRVPGTTNRLLARFATQVLEAFPHSFAPKVGALCTGNPLRKAFQILPNPPLLKAGANTETSTAEVDGENSFNSPLLKRRASGDFDTLKILVVGGSQGAQKLNETVPDAVALLAMPTHIKHQTGAVMVEQVSQRYQNLGIQAEVSAFIDDMVAAYQWADMVICRAGAMTVSEVAAMGVPAIFIPLPSAIDDHQTANARYLTDAHAGILLMQKELTAAHLAEQIQLMSQQLAAMSIAAQQAARLDATEVVAQHCIRVAGL